MGSDSVRAGAALVAATVGAEPASVLGREASSEAALGGALSEAAVSPCGSVVARVGSGRLDSAAGAALTDTWGDVTPDAEASCERSADFAPGASGAVLATSGALGSSATACVDGASPGALPDGSSVLVVVVDSDATPRPLFSVFGADDSSRGALPIWSSVLVVVVDSDATTEPLSSVFGAAASGSVAASLHASATGASLSGDVAAEGFVMDDASPALAACFARGRAAVAEASGAATWPASVVGSTLVVEVAVGASVGDASPALASRFSLAGATVPEGVGPASLPVSVSGSTLVVDASAAARIVDVSLPLAVGSALVVADVAEDSVAASLAGAVPVAGIVAEGSLVAEVPASATIGVLA